MKTLVLGGARSGKSRRAEDLVRAAPSPWAYIATAEAGDAEMAERIRNHRADRGDGWTTIEQRLDLPGALREAQEAGCQTVLIDCLTLWLSNVMLDELDLDKETTRLLDALEATTLNVVLVSNEVGMGLVPETALGRQFRDAQGRLNQTVARRVDMVEFVAAGLPLRLKGPI